MNRYMVYTNKGYPSEQSSIIEARSPGYAIECAVHNQYHTPNTVSIEAVEI